MDLIEIGFYVAKETIIMWAIVYHSSLTSRNEVALLLFSSS